MNWLDILVVLAAAIAGYGGWKLGLLTRALSWVGMLAGLLLAAQSVPWMLRTLGSDDPTRLLLAAASLLVLGSFAGQLLGFVVGNRLRTKLPRRGRARDADRVGGAVAGIVGVFLAVWLLLPAIAEVPGWPARQARTSAIAGAIDDLFPEPPDTVEVLRRLVGANRFPEVLAGLQAAPDLGDPPAYSVIPDAVAARVARSVVLVRGPACRLVQEGSGFVAGDGLVVTNAHVVAGEKATTVVDAAGREHAGTVVAFDASRDLAVLRVPSLDAPALALADADVGDEGSVFGHPGGGPLREAPYRLARRVEAVGRDLYGDHDVHRDVWFMAVTMRPGDSGAPLVDASGAVVGVAFAIAPDRPEVGYALTLDELRPVLDGDLSSAVDTQSCLL